MVEIELPARPPADDGCCCSTQPAALLLSCQARELQYSQPYQHDSISGPRKSHVPVAYVGVELAHRCLSLGPRHWEHQFPSNENLCLKDPSFLISFQQHILQH
jgi:hypothetical protein